MERNNLLLLRGEKGSLADAEHTCNNESDWSSMLKISGNFRCCSCALLLSALVKDGQV